VLIGLTEKMRRWRVLLVVVALATMFGVGATAAHEALDASEPASMAQEHAEKCFVVGLVSALALAAVAAVRRVRPVGRERVREHVPDDAARPPASLVGAARIGASPPTSARLCRFLT
jgi:hypothetical protein